MSSIQKTSIISKQELIHSFGLFYRVITDSERKFPHSITIIEKIGKAYIEHHNEFASFERAKECYNSEVDKYYQKELSILLKEKEEFGSQFTLFKYKTGMMLPKQRKVVKEKLNRIKELEALISSNNEIFIDKLKDNFTSFTYFPKEKQSMYMIDLRNIKKIDISSVVMKNLSIKANETTYSNIHDLNQYDFLLTTNAYNKEGLHLFCLEAADINQYNGNYYSHENLIFLFDDKEKAKEFISEYYLKEKDNIQKILDKSLHEIEQLK